MKKNNQCEKMALPFLFHEPKRARKLLSIGNELRSFAEDISLALSYDFFKKSPFYIVGINFKGEIDFLSDSVLKNTGWKEKEILFQKMETLFLFEKEDREELLKKSFGKKLILKKQGIPLRAKDQNRIYCQWNSSFFHREKYLLFMGVDITAIKELADEREMRMELEIAQERLIQLDRIKMEFIGTVSHELRTPLSIIQASISNLKDGILGPLTEKQMVAVKTSSRNCTRLSHMIENLLDISLLESGRLEFHPTHFSLSSLIHEIVEDFRKIINGEKVFVEEIPKNIPEPTADKEMTARVLTNLLQNAVRFAKTKIVVKAEADSRENGNCITISVMNDGCGIPKEEQKELFSQFVQLHRPVGGAGYKGSGLGLAICKKIVEKNGGKIWVESKAGQGAAFRWTIPVI